MVLLRFIWNKFILINIILFCITCGLIVYLGQNEFRNTLSKIISHNNIDTRNPLTIQCDEGRLGNQMCRYAVLRGLSSLNHRNMSIMPYSMWKLGPFFNIKVPVLRVRKFQRKHPHKLQNDYLEDRDLNISLQTNMISWSKFRCSFTFFNHIRENITEDFTFKTHIKHYVDKALLEIKGNKVNVTFVGIHVRRTDYTWKNSSSWLNAFHGKEVDDEYFVKATNYFRSKYGNVLFVAVSDDRVWCRKHLSHLNIHIMKYMPTAAHDMAVLTQCNHTIMTYGTFGFWGAYLAGGEVIYFDKFLKQGTSKKYRFQFKNMYLPEWIGISTNSSYM